MGVGEEIKKARLKKKISQRELGRKIGKTGQFISLIEKGESNPSVITLKKIADALDVTINELLTEDDKQILILEDFKNALITMAKGKPYEVYSNDKLNLLINLSKLCDKKTQEKFNKIIEKFPNLNPLPNEYKINEPLYNELNAEFVQPMFNELIKAFEMQLNENIEKHKTQLKNYAEWWNSLTPEERNNINKRNERKKVEEKEKQIQDIVTNIAFDVSCIDNDFDYLSYFLREDSTCNYNKCKIMYDFLAEQLKLFIDNTNKLKEEDK